MVGIIVVEDNPDTRDALARNISAHAPFELLAAVGSVAEALQSLSLNPDVLLVDLGLPDGRGEAVIHAAMRLEHKPEVIVITVFGDERHVIGAIEAGATGYLLKDADEVGVVQAIEQLLAGGSPVTPIIARQILKRFNKPPTDAPQPEASVLTPRETEVLQLVSRGFSNNEISELLDMSFHTVTSHIKHIYRKLSVRSRSEAVFEAAQLGIIDIRRE